MMTEVDPPKAPKAPEKDSWPIYLWRRAGEAVMAVLLFYAVIQFSERLSRQERDLIPASSWFKVNEVYVPDHEVGSNPPIIYDRVVYEEFRGFFVVEVQKKLENGLWWSACSGSGVSDYEPGEAIPDNTVTWTWFIARDCTVDVGTYRLRTSWEMKRLGWPTKNTVSLSNEFQVLPRADGATSHPTPAIADEPDDPLHGHSGDN